MSELIRFLRFQRSPNPVSLAVIVTTSRFGPWQAVEDRRCVETLFYPVLALDSQLWIRTAFLVSGGGGRCVSTACLLYPKLSEPFRKLRLKSDRKSQRTSITGVAYFWEH